MRLAFDDFGAGQARLCELAEVRPDYLKFDREMIRDIHTSPQRQQMLAHLVQLVVELGVVPLAEGIESAAESEICRQIGFQLAQGFHFGRPAPVPSLLAALDAPRLPTACSSSDVDAAARLAGDCRDAGAASPHARRTRLESGQPAASRAGHPQIDDQEAMVERCESSSLEAESPD